MTEYDFVNVYLWGRHDILRNNGVRLWDVDYNEIEPTTMEVELAMAQFKRYKPNEKITKSLRDKVRKKLINS